MFPTASLYKAIRPANGPRSEKKIMRIRDLKKIPDPQHCTNIGTRGSKDLFRWGGGEDVKSPGWQGAGWAHQQELWLGPRTARRLENGLASRQGGYLQQNK